MAGPGGVEAGRASLKVLPDLSQFLRSLERFIQRIERQVVIELPTTLDLRGVQESLAEVKARLAADPVTLPAELDTDAGEMRREHAELQAQADANPVEIPVKVDRSQLRDIGLFLGRIKAPDLSGLSASLGAFTRGAGIAGLGIAAAAAVPQVLTLAGSLTQVAGVAGLLPGVAAAAVGGVGALALGLHGVGDALKTAKTPAQAKQLSAAMAALAPNARATVKAIKGLGPAFTSLQRSVQDRLFDQMGLAITELTHSLLPELKTGLNDIASSLGGTFATLLGSLSDLGGTGLVKSMLSDTADAIANMAPGVQAFVSAFSQIGVVATSFLPDLAKGFSTLLGRFDDFVAKAATSGGIDKFIQTGLSGLSDLATVGLEAGKAIFGIVKAAQASGGGTLATLAALLGDIAAAINSPAFQGGLSSFFAGVQSGASRLLSSALPAIGTMIGTLGPVIADFARQAGPALGDAIAALAPVATELLKAFSPALVALIQAVSDVIVQMSPTLTGWARALQSVNPLLLGLAGVAVALLPTLFSLGGSLISVVTGLAGLVGVFTGGGALAGLAAAVGAIILPVLAVVAGIAALAAVFVLAYQNSQPIRDAVAAIGTAFMGMWAVVQPILAQLLAVVMENWPQIQAIAAQVWSTVQTIFLTALVAIQRAVQLVTKIIQVVWALFGDTILGVVRAVFPAILGVIRGALNVIQGVFRTVLAILRGDWSGAWDGIKQVVSGVWTVIKSIVKGGLGAVVAIVSGIGSQLYAAGSSLIQKLIDGITSKIKAVGDAAARIADKIKGFFGGSPVEEGPLLGWNNGKVGKNLADMLADGLYASQSRVAAAASALASQVGAPIGGVGVGGGRTDLSEASLQRLAAILAATPMRTTVSAGQFDYAMGLRR